MKLKGFLAWILVDGKEVNQYGVEVEESKVTSWIPSEAGKVRQLSGPKQLADENCAEIHGEVERFSATSGRGDRRLRVSRWDSMRRSFHKKIRRFTS